jgi:hypothetical protein
MITADPADLGCAFWGAERRGELRVGTWSSPPTSFIADASRFLVDEGEVTVERA